MLSRAWAAALLRAVAAERPAPHGAAIEDLTLAALNESLCLSIEVEERAGEGLDRAHRAGAGTAKGTADRLFEYWASLVIEKRHCDVVESLADKVELAFKSNSIMARREGAVRGVSLPVLYLPVGIAANLPRHFLENIDKTKRVAPP